MSLRTRLTLGIAAVLALVIAGFSVALHAATTRGWETAARARADAIADRVSSGVEWDKGEIDVEMEVQEQLGEPEDAAVAIYHQGRRLHTLGRPAPKPDWPAPVPGAVDDERAQGRHWRGFVLTRSPRIEKEPKGPVPPLVLTVALDVTRDRTSLRRLARTLGILGPGVFLLGVAGTWLAVGRALRPLRAMAEAAARIDERALATRVPLPAARDEVARLGESLNAALDRLEQAFGRERGFIADASHELRTPVTILLTTLEVTLSRARSPEEYREALETALQTSGRMRGIVEALLTLARADAGRLAVRRESIDLAQMLRDAAAQLAPLGAERKIAVAVEAPAPVTVSGDPGLLRQLFDNLIANAIRYNREGGRVDITVSAGPAGATAAVRDTGPGIAAEHLPRLFDRFYRVDKGRSRDEGGAGLGLAIAKCIADLHGGAIAVESTPGEGSTFRVTLPGTAAGAVGSRQ